MDLLYKNEHLSCVNYDKGPRPAIEIKELTGEQFIEGHAVHGKILFLLEGELTCSFGDFNGCNIPQRQMLYLPSDYSFTFRSTQKVRFMIIRLLRKIQFCECYLLESLTRQTAKIDTNRPDTTGEKPFLLKMNRGIDVYTDSLILFMSKGLCCKYYFETKTKELFYLLRAFYPKEELACFFRTALSMDSFFSYFVSHNYHKYRTLSEMAEAMNMTLSGFEKRFKKVFGTSGCKWINEHKAKKIYHAVCNEQTPLKELSTRFGFSSKSTFSDFCKKNLGETPGKIRKKIQLGENEEQTGEKA